MSETETAVPMDDKALFDAATSDAAPATEAPAAEATDEQQPEGNQPRDEHGRFAAKAEATEQTQAAPAVTEQPKPAVQPPAPQAETQREPPPGWLPAWRVREMIEAERKKHEKPPEPVDPWADLPKFTEQVTKQAIDPVAQQLAGTREYYSRELAVMKHGQQTVTDAYQWLSEASNRGDPRVATVLQRALNSIDPFGEIVTAFKRDRAISTVGDDPNAWFEKELERRAASDPAFKDKLAALQGGQQQQQATQADQPVTNVVKLPPSLNRQPGAQAAPDSASMDDASLFAYALK